MGFCLLRGVAFSARTDVLRSKRQNIEDQEDDEVPGKAAELSATKTQTSTKWWGEPGNGEPGTLLDEEPMWGWCPGNHCLVTDCLNEADDCYASLECRDEAKKKIRRC